MNKSLKITKLSRLSVKVKMENWGKNARNEIVMQLREISVRMSEKWVEMQKMWGINVEMQGIKVETLV